MLFLRIWYPRWETGDGSGVWVLVLTALLCMLRCRSMVSPADTKDMLQGRSMASQFADVGRFSPCMLWLRSMVPVAGTKDMLLGWSMPSRIEDGGWFSPCMLWFRSMVPVAGTKDMLQGRSMASRVRDVARFIACMLWSRSMVSFTGTTDMLLGWSMASWIGDAGRSIPIMLWSMLPIVGKAIMLPDKSAVSHQGGGRLLTPMLYYSQQQTLCVPDRGHAKSYFSLMLGLVILGMSGQSYDSRIYTICAPWNGRRGDAYIRVFKPAFLNGLMGITDDYDSLYSHALGTDTGGNAGGPAHTGGAPEIRKSQAAYKARSSKLQSLIYKHVEDASIKNTILESAGSWLL